MDSKIEFQGMDPEWLSIYIYLTAGEEIMCEYGLQEIIPERLNKDSSALSLSAQSNRDLKNWRTFREKMDKDKTRTMRRAEMMGSGMKINIKI